MRSNQPPHSLKLYPWHMFINAPPKVTSNNCQRVAEPLICLRIDWELTEIDNFKNMNKFPKNGNMSHRNVHWNLSLKMSINFSKICGFLLRRNNLQVSHHPLSKFLWFSLINCESNLNVISFEINQNKLLRCCVFWPEFECWAFQTLVKILFFSCFLQVFARFRCKNFKKEADCIFWTYS